jgi:hypothetical protein
MRENRTSGSQSGEWKRGMEAVVRHRQSKEPETAEADPKPPRHSSTLLVSNIDSPRTEGRNSLAGASGLYRTLIPRGRKEVRRNCPGTTNGR